MIHYLDHNATTPVAPEVFEAMVPFLTGEFGNPSSAYPLGKRAAAAIAEARERVAALAGCEPEEVIFTSCGTESINTAILACLELDPDRRHIVTSAVEHSATVKLCERLARKGWEVTWLPVDRGGRLDPAAIAEALREDTAVLSLLWGNNETGVIFPVAEAARIAAEKKVPLHIDAVQAAGKVPLFSTGAGITLLSLSGHKLRCPKGVGALVASRKMRFTPLLAGSQEGGRRAGTQNVASIAAFGRAAELAQAHLAEHAAHMRGMRDRFEARMLERVPGCEVNGDRENRLPNTSNLAFEGIESEGALMLLAERGICCSAGSACTTGAVEPSHVLRAMGFSDARARSSLRFSFGPGSTEADLEAACQAVPEVVAKLRALRPQPGPVAMAS
ncbi:MAG: aminotransferase class V-fold PLP-dependent enzyme [Terrimicrobiaceae bacterium]|nr:aminotransferase class V-fold PLP-dependent enzyme [Terrimicrobiaceae bacterium]